MARDKTDKTDTTPAATLPTNARPAGPFPEATDDGMMPYREIAARWGTDENTVADAFRSAVPVWALPEHLDTVKHCAGELNRAARASEKLIGILRDLPKSEREMLVAAGCVTIQQLEHLRHVLADDALYLIRFQSDPGNARPGGRNPAAYFIAEGVRRLFRRLRKRITWGTNDCRAPSTDFCRGVEHAIGAFGVRADWRGPAREAWEKQMRIQGRLDTCAMNRSLRELRNTNSPK